MIISYLIFACNEHKELDKLLEKLTDFVQEPNEIMVILDDENTTDEVAKIVKKYESEIGCYAHKLNGDFASHKNFGNLCCKGDWIFQLDADELPNDSLLMALHPMLELNPGAEMIYVPRINTVDGLTDEHIEKWGWKVDEKGWVNFPDYQTRLYKNDPTKIQWKNEVHEVIEGHGTYAALPAEESYCLYHHKEIERQEKQNNFYEKINT